MYVHKNDCKNAGIIIRINRYVERLTLKPLYSGCNAMEYWGSTRDNLASYSKLETCECIATDYSQTFIKNDFVHKFCIGNFKV